MSQQFFEELSANAVATGDRAVEGLKNMLHSAGTAVQTALDNRALDPQLQRCEEAHILGAHYCYNREMDAFEPPLDVTALVPYMRYRSSMSEILPGGFTTDRGWGCMYRVEQMVLATALLMLAGRQLAAGLAGGFRTVVGMFADTSRATFSLHRAFAHAQTNNREDERTQRRKRHRNLQRHDNVATRLIPGQWIKPTPGAHVLEDLVAGSELEEAPLRVYTGESGVVYTSELEFDDDLPLLLLIPTAMGVGDSGVNPRYLDALHAAFSAPSSLGLAGGKPGHALYCYGLQGDEFMYMDPHYTAPAINTPVSEWNDEDLATYKAAGIQRIKFLSLAPSMALCFLLRSKEDLRYLEKMNANLEARNVPTLINFVAERTSYEQLSPQDEARILQFDSDDDAD